MVLAVRHVMRKRWVIGEVIDGRRRDWLGSI
jgi:hypothetical protein